jgi:hypothetical protein
MGSTENAPIPISEPASKLFCISFLSRQWICPILKYIVVYRPVAKQWLCKQQPLLCNWWVNNDISDPFLSKWLSKHIPEETRCTQQYSYKGDGGLLCGPRCGVKSLVLEFQVNS